MQTNSRTFSLRLYIYNSMKSDINLIKKPTTRLRD